MGAPEVVLIHFCAKAYYNNLGQVNNVSVRNVTAGKVLVTWSDTYLVTKCIWTYEVIFQPLNSHVRYRINKEDIIVKSFYFTPVEEKDEHVFGTYLVRAVDYWDRVGQDSYSVRYGHF